jgi:Peptidase family M49
MARMGTVKYPALPNLAVVRLTTDIARLSASERVCIPILIQAADLMEDIYWRQVIGPRDEFLASLSDPGLSRKVEINAGPWDRLANDAPFVPGFGERPPGVQFYPADMTVAELERAAAQSVGQPLQSAYTLVRRDEAGHLRALPYHVAFEVQTRAAASYLRRAAQLAEDPGLRRYLDLRAAALESDDYRASDEAWMEMKDNTLDVVIGPIELYDDKLCGYKASHQAIVLVKDRAWSERLVRYTALLPSLQAALPVAPEYRAEAPGLDSDLNVYDAIYHAGFANRPPTASAINLPNDADVVLAKGTRRLQLKNVMRAKFEAIVHPIAEVILAEDELETLSFDAWFEGVMFHEIAHGLGVHRTIDGTTTVQLALRELATAVEEQKADALGQFMLQWIGARGETDLEPATAHLVAHVTDLFRLLRFGGANAYAKISASELNFLVSRGGIARTAEGRYQILVSPAVQAFEDMAERLLTIQGDGDRSAAADWYRTTGGGDGFVEDLERVAEAAIPTDVVYEQGLEVLSLA